MTTQAALNLSAIGQIAHVVSNIETATEFYKDKLGVPHLFSAPPKLAFFNLNGIRLMLAEPENPNESGKIGNNSTLYFKVDDIHGAFETLSGRGIPVADKPHIIAKMGTVELWMAFFYDPDHNLIGIMCEVPIAS
jgi:catechol 2,3-dioxygenase-like lactoylglutathione lyase family enzyme